MNEVLPRLIKSPYKIKDIKACAQLLGHGETTAMKYYLAARSIEELRELVEET